MKFSANLTLLYGEHDFADRFAAAASDGFAGVEFVSPYEHAPDRLAEAVRASGVAVVLFNTPAGDWEAGGRGCACQPGQEALFRSGVERAIGYAKTLSCPRLHVMAGNVPEGVSAEAAEACIVDNLGWAAARLAAEGIVALIEPINPYDMPGYGLGSLAQAERVLARVGHANLRLQFDAYHLAMMGEALVDNFWRLLPLIGHVQVADMPGRHEPGTGEIDFVGFFDALDASGYAGWVGAEYRPKAGTRAGLDWRARI